MKTSGWVFFKVGTATKVSISVTCSLEILSGKCAQAIPPQQTHPPIAFRTIDA